MKIVEPSVRLCWITPDPIKQIEEAARTCYKSEPTGDPMFVQRLIERGHHAMLEFADACLHFVCDRGVTHELVRHRLCSFAQESTRWLGYKEISVIRPPGLTKLACFNWTDSVQRAEQMYVEALTEVAPQIARSILPTCTKTEIRMKTNLREWRTIFGLRLAKSAHPQMREVMAMAFDILQPLCTPVFDEYQVLRDNINA